MELTQKFTEEKKSDIDSLKSIVEMVMSVDLMANNRKRCIVESRMIYAYILREFGYSLNRIGLSLKKDHTTIIHYLTTVRKLIETDSEMLRKYYKCRDMFLEERDIVEPNNKEGLKSQVFSLSTKITVLMAENNNLINEIKKLKQETKTQDKRLNRIIKFIDENTPIGHEFIIERKIIKMFDEQD
jgi:hypothetical protein